VSSVIVNASLRPRRVPPPSAEAAAFHEALPGYAPTPVRELPGVASELGLGRVLVKDESDRLGLPAFKILGASWAVEQALRQESDVRTLVAASAGNHGRAVARVARMRGLGCRIFLPARSLPARRAAIAGEGADVVVVSGGYAEAVARAEKAGTEPGTLLVADVGSTGPAHSVIDGYATLFAEAANQAAHDLLIVPAGVGSLAAAAARHGARRGVPVIAVEPATAACLVDSLAAGRPVAVDNPGTVMAGLDCAEVSPAAWPSLQSGIAGALSVDDAAAVAAMGELEQAGMRIGECGAAPLAGLRRLMTDPECEALRTTVAVGTDKAALLIATEGRTGE
jgi:diaminopropionate ammonia-lyase